MTPRTYLLNPGAVASERAALTLRANGVALLPPVLRHGSPMRGFNRVSGGLFALLGSLLLATRRAA